jgi:hypothetical protein
MKKILAIILVLALCGIAYAGPTAVYDGVSSVFSGTSNGIAMTPVIGNALAGDTTVVTVGATEVYRLMRVDFKPETDVTGTVNIQIGSTDVYSVVDPLADNYYGMNLVTNFVEGALGEDLVINAPASADIYYNVHGRTD